MKPQAIHIRIARLVIDSAIDDGVALTHDSAALAEIIGTHFQMGSMSANGGTSWQRAVADGVASRLQDAGVSTRHTGVPHGYD